MTQMSATKSRIAIAAALAALTAPALADEVTACSVCGDPTWPALENPAPPVTLHVEGGEAEALRSMDPTWPETTVALPSMRLVSLPADSPQLDPLDPQRPAVRYAVVLDAAATHITRR